MAVNVETSARVDFQMGGSGQVEGTESDCVGQID